MQISRGPVRYGPGGYFTEIIPQINTSSCVAVHSPSLLITVALSLSLSIASGQQTPQHHVRPSVRPSRAPHTHTHTINSRLVFALRITAAARKLNEIFTTSFSRTTHASAWHRNVSKQVQIWSESPTETQSSSHHPFITIICRPPVRLLQYDRCSMPTAVHTSIKTKVKKVIDYSECAAVVTTLVGRQWRYRSPDSWRQRHSDVRWSAVLTNGIFHATDAFQRHICVQPIRKQNSAMTSS